MNEKQALKKISLNLTAISDILLGSIVLTGNYRFEPKIIALTATCLASNYTYIKVRKNTRKN
ncbi:MAG: hypothetical protein PUC82_03360 [bacterium]|nr:hypothetical protein [bacterium]